MKNKYLLFNGRSHSNGQESSGIGDQHAYPGHISCFASHSDPAFPAKQLGWESYFYCAQTFFYMNTKNSSSLNFHLISERLVFNCWKRMKRARILKTEIVKDGVKENTDMKTVKDKKVFSYHQQG